MLNGINIVRRLQAAKIPVEGVTFPQTVRRGTLCMSTDPGKTFIYRWFDEDETISIKARKEQPQKKTVVDPKEDDSEDL